MSNKTRQAIVAGQFYPASSTAIKRSIKKYLDKVEQKDFDLNKLYGVISPHAGYPYSGEIAAYSYDIIAKQEAHKIIVIAPSHREYIDGFSIYPGNYYATPLGKIPLDMDLIEDITKRTSCVKKAMTGHKQEHSLEVQLPFLQYILDEFSLIPIVAGKVEKEQVEELAECLADLSNESQFTVVASSDLSHFHGYDQANEIDRELIERLKKFKVSNLVQAHKDRSLEACGMIPISVLMEYALKAGEPSFMELDHRNSGDTGGTRDRVVGYLAAAVYE
ncbi:MAG: AmmeMemoRadiSam system protein B [Candidatus Marinimicrobia bacterium]|nr:AmmeMemoRadiSam system protein B [Candidatus Neomarinimicrobiota bacterium]